MPTPHGSRGGMAFSADELRVLRRALAEALRHAPLPPAARRPVPVVPAPAGEQVGAGEFRRLAEALEEAVREGVRLRSFLLADLAPHREPLPGGLLTAPGRGCGAVMPPAEVPPAGPPRDPEPDRRVPTPAEVWPPRRKTRP